MTSEEKAQLEKRLTKLEGDSLKKLWLQFLIFPIILAALGYYFQRTIDQSQKRIEQLKITQDIVNTVFNDSNYGKTVAMRQILNEVLDNDDLSQKLGLEIDKRLESILMAGDKKKAKDVLDAVKRSTDSNYLKPVLSKYQKAIEKEREAFRYLAKRDFNNAEKSFRELDSIYPTFHNASEISTYLRNNRQSMGSEDDKTRIVNHIITKLNWGAPEDLIEEIKTSM